MKKNIRSIIALLLIIFSVSSLLGSGFINKLDDNNEYVAVYSDDDTLLYNKK